MPSVSVYLNDSILKELSQEAANHNMELPRYINLIVSSWHGSRGEILEKENKKLLIVIDHYKRELGASDPISE